MLFSYILGQNHIKSYLTSAADRGRNPHAQIFVGPEGSGILSVAIAYAQYIICKNNNGENSAENTCNLQFKNFSHPDLHFIYPVSKNNEGKETINDYYKDWLNFIEKNLYASLLDWLKYIDVEKKQPIIRAEEINELSKKAYLKSYSGGHKVFLIWYADKMNESASNKFLKLLEEPPTDTIFILLTENKNKLLQTINSRCQEIDFLALPEEMIKNGLIEKYHIDENLASKIAHQSEGNFNKAIHLIDDNEDEEQFEQWFVFWVRAAFRAVKQASMIQEMVNWANLISKESRDKQIKFLQYCISFFRQALLFNYQAKELVFIEPLTENFQFDKFAQYIHGSNINDIFKELNDAIFYIGRNANSEIVLTDLSIKLTRLLHKKETA